MKLVIDIPESDYRYIKELQSLVIARGTCKTIQRDVINAIKNGTPYEERQNVDVLNKIPKDFVYDTETSEFYCYRNKYTGEEIHIIKQPKTYILADTRGKENEADN